MLKNSESVAAAKEIEWLKEEINSRDIKIKWIQNKVKTEMDLHKVSLYFVLSKLFFYGYKCYLLIQLLGLPYKNRHVVTKDTAG